MLGNALTDPADSPPFNTAGGQTPHRPFSPGEFLLRIKLFRTLRFRLAVTFLLVLLAILAIVGVFGARTLRTILADQSEDELKEQIGALKKWIQFEGGEPIWFVDHTDPEEEAEVSRLDAVYVVADDAGRVHLGSTEQAKQLSDRALILAEMAQMQKTHEPVIKIIIGADNTPYQIISSTMTDPERGRKWYVAEGLSLANDRRVLHQFERNFWIFSVVAVFAGMLASWIFAASILQPLNTVEKAAQEITGSSLGLQIPKRGADDELDRLIDSFNAMSGRLKASFEQVRQFSTDVSHELRTPLTAIQGQLEVALFTATRKEQLQEAIENALQDVERLANLVRALLLLSQSESGQIPIHKVVVDLGELVQDLVDQFQIPAEAEGVKLTQTNFEPVLCEVDRTQIERLITNLLSNAIKYTPKGGWVQACTQHLGDSVKLVVEDSGVGIPPHHLSHIFNRFYRVPDPNPEKGLGLGLSFVAAIVKAHNGEIQVRSEPGKGSRFEVTLPAGAVRTLLETPALHA